MKQNLPKAFILLMLIFFQTNSTISAPLTDSVLKFKIMVIKRDPLDSLFRAGITEIVFQTKNPTGEGATRLKYHLVAYAKKRNGNYIKINNILFARRTHDKFEEIKADDGDGFTSSFGNLVLHQNDFPATTEAGLRYIILRPEKYDDDMDYVSYEGFYATTPDDDITTKQIREKTVVPAGFSINPSPPRNS